MRPFGSLAAESAAAEAAAADDGQWEHLLDQLIRAPRNDVLLLQARCRGDVAEMEGR